MGFYLFYWLKGEFCLFCFTWGVNSVIQIFSEKIIHNEKGNYLFNDYGHEYG